MKTKNNPARRDSGQVMLFIVFVILFLVMFVSLYISRSLARHAKVSNGVVSSVQAYYVADSSSEDVLYQLSDPAFDVDLTTSTPITLDNYFNPQGGNALAFVSEEGPSTLKVDVIGTYKNTSRAIQLFW
jgi:hypothetical protein